MTPAWNWAQSIRATERNLQSNWSETSFQAETKLLRALSS